MTVDELDQPFRPAELTIIERDSGALEGYIRTERGDVRIMASYMSFETTLVLDKLHVSGEGLTLPILREAARSLARQEQVDRIIIQGGERRSGAKPGHIPTIIIVERTP